MVTRMLSCPASIFCSVRILRSANSERRSCVSPAALLSRRRLAPKRAKSIVSPGADPPHYAALVRDTEPPFGMDGSQSPARFRYRLPKHIAGVQYEIRASTDLLDWSAPTLQNRMIENGSMTELWEAYLPSAAKAFFQIRVTESP